MTKNWTDHVDMSPPRADAESELSRCRARVARLERVAEAARELASEWDGQDEKWLTEGEKGLRKRLAALDAEPGGGK